MNVISMKTDELSTWNFDVESMTKMCPLDVAHFGAAIENTSTHSDCSCGCYGNHEKLVHFRMNCEATMKLILLGLHLLVIPCDYRNLVSFGIKFNIH